MDISIIIVNYRSKDKLEECLKSLRASDWSSLRFEIIVVENNSGDDLSDLENRFTFTLVKSKRNLGMGGGNNLGIKIAQADFLLILNPDTILYPQAIKVLYEYMQSDSQLRIVGPKLLNPDLSLQLSCSRFPKFYTPILRRTFLGRIFKREINRFLMKDFSHDTIREVDWIMGSCLLIRRDGFQGFDERFFMYFEDIDICRQAWKDGKKVVYNPEATVIHCHGRASAQSRWYSVFRNKMAREHIKSWFRYFRKWVFARTRKNF